MFIFDDSLLVSSHHHWCAVFSSSTPEFYLVFITYSNLFAFYLSSSGCVMGTNQQEFYLIPHTTSVVDEYAEKYEKAYSKSASINMSMGQVIHAYVHSHLKMVKPAHHHKGHKGHHHHMSATSPTGAQVCEMTTGENATKVGSTNHTTMSHSVSAGHLPSISNSTQGKLNKANIHCNTEPTTPVSLVKSTTGFFHSASAAALPNIATTQKPNLSRQNTHMSAEELHTDILSHLTDYTVFFDDSQLKSMSAVLVTKPLDLVPIASVCVDQYCVFFTPVHVVD